MKKVYKYNLDLNDYTSVDLPEGSSILHVDMQNDILCLWALVDVDIKKMVYRELRIAGTGHPIVDDSVIYINTFTMENKQLVFHVFEVNN